MRSPPGADMKRADLASSLGALAIGLGLGLLLPPQSSLIGATMLIIGALVHGWGMLDKHRLEAQGRLAAPRWSATLYWACWILIALVGAALAIRAFT